MGSCCQLEIKKCSQVYIDSLPSPHIQILNQAINSMQVPINTTQYKANNETFTPRIMENEEIAHFHILENVIEEYRKSISECDISKILLPKRLETIKETNSEISIKKSSRMDQRGMMTSSLYCMKYKSNLEETEKGLFESEKETYEKKIGDKDAQKSTVIDDNNQCEEKRMKVKKPSCYFTNLMNNSESVVDLDNNSISIGNRYEINSRDKILQKFNLSTKDSCCNADSDNYSNNNHNTNRNYRFTSYNQINCIPKEILE